jgi:hypothetical protein
MTWKKSMYAAFAIRSLLDMETTHIHMLENIKMIVVVTNVT